MFVFIFITVGALIPYLAKGDFPRAELKKSTVWPSINKESKDIMSIEVVIAYCPHEKFFELCKHAFIASVKEPYTLRL